jgi:integrase
MATVQKKRGRKEKPYPASWGEPIVGLRRRKHDGRWLIVATGQTFTEPDERRAVERFRRTAGADADARELARRQGEQQLHLSTAQIWRYVAEQIRARPKWVAEQTGIEEIGYLADLLPPQPLPKLAELESAWRDHARVGAEERRKVLAAWEDFKATARINGVADITAASVIGYRDTIYGRGKSGKYQLHLFNRIRRVVTFARERGLAPERLARSHETLKLLKPSESTVSLDPQPVEREDFAKLLAKAVGDDRALLLLMLNGALYLKEAVSLKWEHVDSGNLIAHRSKKGKIVRVAPLWRETIEALAKVQRRGEAIFYGANGLPLTVSGAGKRFRKLRKAAGVPDVEASQLRDGAATAAAAANVSSEVCNLYRGHRCGIGDHYVKRNPLMVQPATDAVYTHYFA